MKFFWMLLCAFFIIGCSEQKSVNFMKLYNCLKIWTPVYYPNSAAVLEMCKNSGEDWSK